MGASGEMVEMRNPHFQNGFEMTFIEPENRSSV